jgi:hypothetical protein
MCTDQLRTNAFQYSYGSTNRRGSEELRNEGHPGRPYRHETGAVIRSILQENSNASLRTIAETLSISLGMARTHLLQIGDTLKTLPWVLHALIYELKQGRLTKFLELPPKLRTHTIIGGISSRHESFFYDEDVRNRTETARDENMPEVENRTIPFRKTCSLFYGISTSSMLLQFFLLKPHSARHGSLIEIWSSWFRNSPWLGGVQGQEN